MSTLQRNFLPYMYARRFVVAEFTQKETTEYARFPGGYCAGLTLAWLNMRLRMENWPKRPEDEQTKRNCANAADIYETYTKFHDRDPGNNPAEQTSRFARGVSHAVGLDVMEDFPVTQTRAAIESVAGSLRLEIDPGFKTAVWEEGVDGHIFIHDLVARGYGLYYISMSTRLKPKDGKARPDGSHAIGLHVFSNSLDADCEFFDSNVAQLHFDQPNDIRWAFYDLLKSYSAIHDYNFYKGAAFRMREKKY